MISTSPTPSQAVQVPAESLSRLFLRFLHFGLLAWGGPVAQIAMLRQSFVEEKKWVSSEHFNRVLALYQVLPGPEAHEMCVYFGMLSRGRIGGILAGLGFMLPRFVLIFALSWLYVRFGFGAAGSMGLVFAFVQAAVAALVVRAVHRIGSHVLLDGWLWAIALMSFAAQLLGVHFSIALAGGGFIYVLAKHRTAAAVAASVMVGVFVLAWAYRTGFQLQGLATNEVSKCWTVRISEPPADLCIGPESRAADVRRRIHRDSATAAGCGHSGCVDVQHAVPRRLGTVRLAPCPADHLRHLRRLRRRRAARCLADDHRRIRTGFRIHPSSP